ncbi:toxic anion resistance protein [Sporanaerobacter sp. PP17-6a]|uniref:toxic anion resistance protein n=1 Tax=Sporanaerobacter sp. PP17-6a TaxID=1891289 RepID=UPI0008A040A6|nr:toxic anion resistance protein [Sporanaerobacter sp. PP17-6a]SCL92912.1 TelA-like protein [Sporanaerobacter sp. PP17-6a]
METNGRDQEIEKDIKSEIVNVDEHLLNLKEEDKKKVAEIVKEIDIKDTQAIIQFGASAQKEVADFSDTLLQEVRTKDTGYVGETLGDLMTEIKSVEVDSLLKKGMFDGLFGGLKKKVSKFMTGYQSVSVNIDKITSNLDKAKMTLLRDIKMLDNLYDKNLEYLNTLDMYILAGNIKLKELNEELLPELQRKVTETGNSLDAQKFKNFEQLANRFEKKLHDLKLSRMIAIQTAPQIRIIQGNNQTLVEKIQSSIMNTIPLWKNQVVITISLLRQENALKLQEEVSKTTNDLLTKNSELLKDNSIRVAKETEKGIVEIETLRNVHNNLIATIEETIRIQEEGKTKRASAEVELQNIENELKQKLIGLKK